VARTKLSRSVEEEELTLRKMRKRKKMHRGVSKADHPTKSKNKGREEEERARERGTVVGGSR
jgi:hypothetical protein